MPQTDLIARLEAEAVKHEAISAKIATSVSDYSARRFYSLSGLCQRESLRSSTLAADLRAAAAAVRLVAECREALGKAKRTSKGWYEHTTEALAAIAEWEGKL